MCRCLAAYILVQQFMKVLTEHIRATPKQVPPQGSSITNQKSQVVLKLHSVTGKQSQTFSHEWRKNKN